MGCIALDFDVSTMKSSLQTVLIAFSFWSVIAPFPPFQIVAKLAAGLHKPNKLTLVPHSSVAQLFTTVPIGKVRNLGGKLGENITKDLQIETMAQLAEVSQNKLIQLYGEKTGCVCLCVKMFLVDEMRAHFYLLSFSREVWIFRTLTSQPCSFIGRRWLSSLSNGYDFESVENRLLAKSIGCAKTFPGKLALTTVAEMSKWVNNLSDELDERLREDAKKNHRVPRLLVVSNGHQSRSVTLTGNSFTRVFLYNEVMRVLRKLNSAPPNSDALVPPLEVLQFNAQKFVPLEEKSSITKYLTANNARQSESGQ